MEARPPTCWTQATRPPGTVRGSSNLPRGVASGPFTQADTGKTTSTSMHSGQNSRS
jgi:hypothetical protein